MRPALHMRLVEKAEAALTSAVEVYNKPAFAYREETFAILAINAWELLLKAKVLKNHGNAPKSIRVYVPRKTRSGTLSKKRYLQRNRAGNPMTIGLGPCITALDESAESKLNTAIKANLDALIEIRDNAAHYVNASPVLARQVLEIGTATVKNFVILAKQWFDRELSKSLSLVLPLAFIDGAADIAAVTVSADESKLIKYLQTLALTPGAQNEIFNVAVRIAVKFERSKLDSASKVVISDDPSATKISLSEEDIRERYPWDYTELIKRLEARYTNFKCNKRFHDIRKPLKSDKKYVNQRYLDPGNPRSAKKDFYNANVLQVFDKHYTTRKS